MKYNLKFHHRGDRSGGECLEIGEELETGGTELARIDTYLVAFVYLYMEYGCRYDDTALTS